MAASSEYTSLDVEAGASDTTETVTSQNQDNESDIASLQSTTTKANTVITDVTEEDIKHDHIPIDYTSKSRTADKLAIVDNKRKGKSPSPNSINSINSSADSYSRTLSSANKKDSNNISLKKILDTKPMILTGHNNEQPGAAVIDEIFSDIYFSGNWNRGSYHIDEQDNEEYKHKLECRLQFYRPLTVFGDDEMFELIDLQKKENREQATFYSELQFINTPYPLPSQRLKRLLYPFKSFKHIEQQNPQFKKQLETVNHDEQEYYIRIRDRAARLKKLYGQVTKFQTNDNKNSDIHKLKREYKIDDNNIGVISELNIPPWIKNGWYGDCALARNRNLRMPQYKPKTFSSFYPRTARWDRIMRGCYELDWTDEDVIMDIIQYDSEKYNSPLEVILSLRKERGLFDSQNQQSWTEFKPFARDPFQHIYSFYNVTHVTLDMENSIYNRIRDLYWTLHCMWFIGSRFDCDGCVRVPALINPIEWQYTIGLKIIWDGIKVIGNIGKLHQCSQKHCGERNAGNKTLQFLKKVTYAFDFNDEQIYDFRYLLYLLRHTLFNQLFHCLSKHSGKYLAKVFAKQKKEQKYGIEMAHDEEYRFILDYFRFLVITNNMYEFFSPAQMGKLWQYMAGTFEELRMIYPEISINTIENEYQDLIETHRHLSVTKTMTAKSYKYYFGNKYYTNREKNIWSDARGVIKQYCIKNTLFPIPDIFEGVYQSHNIKSEANPFLCDIKNLTESDNKKYKREKLKKFISGFVLRMLEVPTSFYLTEIKYPFLCNLIRACIKYELPEFAQLLLNHSITSALINFKYESNASDKLYKSNVEYHNLNKSQKRYLETKFTWPFILFTEYLSFNPRQFHREHLCHIIEETNHFKQCIRNEKQNYTNKSQRKILSYSNRIKLQKQKFDAWQHANENNKIPYYPLAVLLRFAICERTNAQIDEEMGGELKQEGNDFIISKSVITALQTILKFPQLSTRILMNTYNLKELVNNLTYNEFKTVYGAIFKYNSKYQEHPQMYEVFKKQWMEYAKQIKILLDIYHEPQQKLYRELVWLGFYQFHQTVYTSNPNHKDLLFNYYNETHFQLMYDKHKLDIKQQQNGFINDVIILFKEFGYNNNDSNHTFYGNYYREFVEREEGNDTESDDDDDDEPVEQINEQLHENDDEEEDEEEEEEEDDNSLVDTSDASDDDEHDVSDDDDDDEEEEEEKEEIEDKMLETGKHRRVDTETMRQEQFAKQVGITQDENNENNPFANRNEDSDDDDEVQLEKKKILHEKKDNDNNQNVNDNDNNDNVNDNDNENKDKVNDNENEKEDELDDFDEYDSDDAVLQNKKRGSNEYNAEDVEQFKKSPAESPLLTHINEEDIDDEQMDDIQQDIQQNDDEQDGLGDISMTIKPTKSKTKHTKHGSDMIAELLEEMVIDEVNVEQQQDLLADQYAKTKEESKQQAPQDDDDENENEFKVNVGNTVRHMKKDSRRNALLFEDERKSDEDSNSDKKKPDDEHDDQHDADEEEEDESDESDDDDDDEFRANKEWANTLLNNPNIVGMQSRDAMLQRKEEQQDLYKRHQIIRLKEDEQENLYSILDLENTQFIDQIMFNNNNNSATSDNNNDNNEFGWKPDSIDRLVDDIAAPPTAIHESDHDNMDMIEREDDDTFCDELFFRIRDKRWTAKKTDPISAISGAEAENSYVMLRDLTEPLALSELLGDFQKAGQIMLSRIDDMQASLIVENKLHSGVLKAHQTDEKNLYIEKEELLATNEKLERELKLLRDKRDANKLETAALKTNLESYILKYNSLKEISTQKLRDQLRIFEIYKSQCKQLSKRISDVSYQTEIGYKRYTRLLAFKKQQQLNICALDIEIESMEKEKALKGTELGNLEQEQLSIDNNEKLYVSRLKEQLRRLGKGMENKEKSCNIFRRNVVEERLRIHTIDDSLKKLRTNANPTTDSDQQLINATQHEALQAREKYAETTQQHSFLTNIKQHEKVLIGCIERVQGIDDNIYAKKWNIIQKSWNLKKHLLQTGKLIQMKKYLLKKEKNSKKHKKKLSKAHFRKDSIKNLSYGASQQFKKQSQDFGAY